MTQHYFEAQKFYFLLWLITLLQFLLLIIISYNIRIGREFLIQPTLSHGFPFSMIPYFPLLFPACSVWGAVTTGSAVCNGNLTVCGIWVTSSWNWTVLHTGQVLSQPFGILTWTIPVSLAPKLDKDVTTKEHYRQIFLMSIYATLKRIVYHVQVNFEF